MKIELYSAYDRDDGVQLKVNGVEIVFANFDEDGSAGMAIVSNVAHGLADLFNVDIIENEVDEIVR